ncbi:MAG: TolB family protein [Mycobacteriales bacterium]
MRRTCSALLVLAVAATPLLPAPSAVAAESATSAPPALAYSLASSTRSELRTIEPTTGATKTLAAAAGELDVATWSRTTSRVYYAHLTDAGADTTTGQLDSVPDTGGAPRNESPADAESADLSPDGTMFVFEREGQLWNAPSAGGVPTRLTGAGGLKPRFSPDGTRIVFTRPVGSNLDVFTVGVEGTGLKRITAAGNVDFSGAYSPDGKRLLFTRLSSEGDPAVFAVNVDGTHLRKVADLAADPDWAANGWIAYQVLDQRDIAQVAVLSPGVPGTESVLTDNGLDTVSLRFLSGAAPAAPAS